MQNTTLNGIDAAFENAYANMAHMLNSVGDSAKTMTLTGSEDGNRIEEPQASYDAQRNDEPAWSIHATHMD